MIYLRVKNIINIIVIYNHLHLSESTARIFQSQTKNKFEVKVYMIEMFVQAKSCFESIIVSQV